MMSNTSADLWIEATAPLGDAVEESGQFGGVCAPIGARAKKKGLTIPVFLQIYLFLPQLRETAHVLESGLKLGQLMEHILSNWVGPGGADSASRVQSERFRPV